MQRSTYLLFLLSLCILLQSCRQDTQHLQAADAVMESDADSAYALLQQDVARPKDKDADYWAYYYLLLTQAAYKLYKPVPNDSVIQSVVGHYEQSGDSERLCRAYYYQAMTLYEQGHHAVALSILKKGRDLAERLHDHGLLSKYDESLCMVNCEAGCDSLMLVYGKLFLEDARQTNDTACVFRAYTHVAMAYYRLGDKKQEREYMLQARPLLEKMDAESRAYALTNMACMFHDQGDLLASKNLLEQSLKAHPLANTYAELGDVCADLGHTSEADVCWQKALRTADAQTRLNVLTSVYEQYKSHKEHAKALSTLESIRHLEDSLHNAAETAVLAEIQQKYDKQVVETRLYRILTWMFAIIFIASMMFMLLYFYYQRTVRTYRNKLDESFMKLRETYVTISRLENENRQQESKNEKSTKQIEQLQKKADELHQEAYERIGRGKDVYDKVQANIPIQYRDDENCLIEYYSVFHHQTYREWTRDYSHLSARLLVYLILGDMGKSDGEVERILSIGSSSVRSLKSRVKAKRNTKTEPLFGARKALSLW